MQESKGRVAVVRNLSDKDIQLIKKNYSKLTQIYYENKDNKDCIRDLIQLSRCIVQVISSKQESDTLSIISTMEILKVKSKSCPELIKETDIAIEHLKNTKVNSIQYQELIYCLKRSELFVVGCTIGIRFFEKINMTHSQFDWKEIINESSRNISINPILCIEYIFQICRNNQIYSRLVVKSGLVKYIFLSYIANTINDKFNLYKAIKLLKTMANVQKNLIKDKQKSLALIIYTYSNYIPVIEEICSKCYDEEYGQLIDSKRRFDQSTIDQPYLWSYNESFTNKNLSANTISQFFKMLDKELSEEVSTKVYAILNNFSRFRLAQFEQLLSKCKNTSILQRFKNLHDSKGKENKIGKLDENIKKKFDVQKDAGFMMQRVSKIPKNNEQLGDIILILKQKDRANQFQSDTLKNVKQRALNSLKTAIVQKNKLNLNLILKEVELNDTELLSKLLEILELNMTMNEDLIDSIDAQRVLEIIKWIEDNYKGEMIEWGSISQIVTILNPQNQWINHIKEIPEKMHWILGFQSSPEPTQRQEDQHDLIKKVMEVYKKSLIKKQKIPLLIGFLGRVLDKKSKIKLYKQNKQLFEIIFNNIKSNNDYKYNVLMMSYFIKNWSQPEQHQTEEETRQSNKYFQEIIQMLINFILNNFRNTEQEYQFLEKALPYHFPIQRISQNVQYLIDLYGKLASYVYRQNQVKNNSKIHISYTKIKKITKYEPGESQSILQTLKFLEQNSEILQEDELSKFLETLINKKLIYWLVYPNFANIINSLLSILKNTENPAIKENLSTILYKMIQLLNLNKDITEDQKQEIYETVLQCIQELQKKQVYIEKQKLIKICEKIQELELRTQFISLLSNYKNPLRQIKKQQKKAKPQEKESISHQQTNSKHNISNNSGSLDHSSAGKAHQEQIKQKASQNVQNFAQESHLDDNISFEEQLQVLSNKKNNSAHEIDILQALRQLKKIIQKQLPQEHYEILHHVFMTKALKQEYKDILGHLLARFYPHRSEALRKKILELLAMKDKTCLSKETCYQLLKNFPQTFTLAKRWKLNGRQWLVLAMIRFTEGYCGDSSQVIEYNVLKQTDLQFFYDQKYHEIIRKSFDKISVSQDFLHYLVLIGTSARLKQIKQYYIKQKLHLSILNAYMGHAQNPKLVGNVSYALSAISYSQTDASLQIALQQKPLMQLFDSYKTNASNKIIVQSGCSLIANLAYSNDEIKELLRRLNVAQILMMMFGINLFNNPDISTYKQLLRAIGNLSLSPKFSHEIIDRQFCSLSVALAGGLDIFVNFDDKKASLMKTMIDLIANLAAHKYKLELFHSQQLTDLIVTLLEISQSYPAILIACIDTIDCLCQNQVIENYIVTEKKIPYLLIDVLKIQTDEKIVVKSTRLLTNLTINQSCIPYILEANLLSVLANIVMPHFYGNKLAAEQNKKMETYILKIITRISNSKQSQELILKSGYLDCLIRTIETAEVIQEIYIEILYQYSANLPSFLGKRAFLCLVRIIIKKISNREVIFKCFKTIKNFSNKFEKEEEDEVFQGISTMYEKQMQKDWKQDFLYLLGYHLLRSYKLRAILSKRKDKIYDTMKKNSLDTKYMDICKEILFLMFNTYKSIPDVETEEQKCQQAFNALKQGFKCNLFRIDGSSKTAIIDINQEYKIRAYKYPNGEIKDKYVINLKNLKDFNFNYVATEDSWLQSVFSSQKGIFDFKVLNPSFCVTLFGLQSWREINFINVQFESIEVKLNFIKCICFLYRKIE